MGFYQRWILPRLIDLAMGAESLDVYRRITIAAASGLMLEIGVGSGQNLLLYRSLSDVAGPDYRRHAGNGRR
jgi:hypothetical protein